MKNKIAILIACWLASVSSLKGQCISRDSLWNRLLVLWYSPPVPPAEQLKELLNYEAGIRHCAYRYDSTHAFLLFRIGATCHRQADYLRGVQYARQSINMVMTNAGKTSINEKHVIKYYYFLSVMYDSLSQVTEQMKALDSCITAAKRYKSVDLFCIAALHKRAEYFYDVGDYHRCFSYADNCEKLAVEYVGSGAAKDSLAAINFAANCFQWQVNVLLQLKDNEVAERLLTRKIDECKKTGNEIYLVTLYHQLARVKANKGDYTKARLYYTKALEYAKKFRFDINCKVIWCDLGYNVYFKEYRDLDKALVAYSKALTFINRDKSRSRDDAIESLNVIGNIAAVYTKKGLYDSAFHYFQLAFDAIKPGSSEKDLLLSSLDDFVKTKRIYYLTDLLINKGDAYLAQFVQSGQIGFLQEAVRVYKTTDRFLDRIKAEQSALQSKLFWRSDTRRLYEHAIEACYKNGNMDDAFYFFERSRAVLLSDQLNEQRWLGQSDILKQVQLKKNILQKERQLASLDASSENNKTLSNDLFSQQQELDRLINTIKVNNPFYYQSFIDTGFISLPVVQNEILKDRQALVEIFAGDSAVYCLVITAQKAQLKKVKKNIFDSIALLYISYISNPDLMNRNFDAFVNTSSELFQLMFKDNPLPTGRIIISPDGHYFPFEALVIHARPLNYFLNDHAVSYTYSARYLMNCFVSSSGNTSNNFLGIAPVQYPANMNLAALPGSDKSLHRLHSLVSGANKLIAAEATRNNFIQRFYQYRIVQLYTHASDSSSNGEPVIFFADSALYLSDLISEKKPVTSLIVLSACETGSGRLYQGEGVFSFNRGFAALGIPAAITNLWSVDNEATYRLTELFYKYLADGLAADVALQKAKIEFIQQASKEKKLPAYWAASILAGKADVIELKKTYSRKNATLLIGLFFIAACLVWWKRRSRRQVDV
jgi:CHAT domain-containing protein